MSDALINGGEMGARTREFDWSTTSLGAVEHWPQSLKTAVSIMLGCQYPLLIWWGPELIHFYNDAYVPYSASAIRARSDGPPQKCGRKRGRRQPDREVRRATRRSLA